MMDGGCSVENRNLAAEEHRTTVAGHRMYSLRAGHGRPLILLHGLLGAAACWVPAMEALLDEGGAQIFAVDAIGMGGSERVPGLDASLRAEAARLLAFMDREGIEQADLCGSSHGGALAMYFAARYPGRVRSLILQAPANPFCSKSQPQIRFFGEGLGRFLGHLLPWMPRHLQASLLERMYGDPARIQQGTLETYVRSLRVPGTVSYVLAVLRSWSSDMLELRGLLKRLRGLPCLLLWGAEDRAVSLASGEALSRALGSPLEVLPGVGHLPYEEIPHEFASRVLQFLRSLDKPGLGQAI